MYTLRVLPVGWGPKISIVLIEEAGTSANTARPPGRAVDGITTPFPSYKTILSGAVPTEPCTSCTNVGCSGVVVGVAVNVVGDALGTAVGVVVGSAEAAGPGTMVKPLVLHGILQEPLLHTPLQH